VHVFYHHYLQLRDHHLINITPAPVLSGLKRFDDGMIRLVKVLCGMFILGGVAAADMAADHTQAQMNPIIAHFHAFLTAQATRRDVLHLIEVRALIRCHCHSGFLSLNSWFLLLL
jgi:hypothetical protein